MRRNEVHSFTDAEIARPRETKNRKRTCQKLCSRRMGKSIAKRIAQIGFDSDVGAESLRTDVAQRRKSETGHQCERNAIITGDLWCVKEKEFVNNAGSQSGAIQRGASLKQNVQDFAAAQFGKNGTQVEAALFCSELYDFDSCVL